MTSSHRQAARGRGQLRRRAVPPTFAVVSDDSCRDLRTCQCTYFPVSWRSPSRLREFPRWVKADCHVMHGAELTKMRAIFHRVFRWNAWRFEPVRAHGLPGHGKATLQCVDRGGEDAIDRRQWGRCPQFLCRGLSSGGADPARAGDYLWTDRPLAWPSQRRPSRRSCAACSAGWLEIPWQRVINAAGRVSSRCDRHYEGIQRALLEAEGVRFDLYGSVDLQKFSWGGPLAGEHNRHSETHQPQGTH